MPKAGNKPQHQVWIRDHLDYPHKDYCLIWPFHSTNNGYGTFLENGKKKYVHRRICELKNGPAPSPKHQATHSCNRGHEGCANWHHLRWKTRSENQLEAAPHRKLKLTPEQAAEIRSLRGVEANAITAARFNVREATVRDIQAGRTWRSDTRLRRLLSDSDVQNIRLLKGLNTAKVVAASYRVQTITIKKIWNRESWKHIPDAKVSLPSGQRI